MKILLQAIKSLLRKLENCFREDGIIKQTSLPKGYPYSGTIIEILPSITVEITSELGEIISTKFILVAGTEYTVTWNGVKYDCIARRGSYIVGDGVAVGSDDINEEIPFYILALDTPLDVGDGHKVYGMLLPKDNSTSATFSISENPITKIDAKYLPETASNLVNGSAEGSLRSIYSKEESDSYIMGKYAVALGRNTTASGDSSHAEGSKTTASGYWSHAEGGNTTASGHYSHAEGGNTTASGHYSHAEGSDTIAASDYQHVQGNYNIKDADDKYAHIVGNGTSSNRSNAHTLDWDGNAWFAGKLKVGGTGWDNEAAVYVLTDPIINTALPASGTALTANTIYNVSAAVGTYAFTAPATGWAHGKFTTGASASVSFAGTFLGAAPAIEASKTYEFDVLDGVWAVQEVVSA